MFRGKGKQERRNKWGKCENEKKKTNKKKIRLVQKGVEMR